MSFWFTQAVHSGADLEAAISNCMGYKAEVLSVNLPSVYSAVFFSKDLMYLYPCDVLRVKASWLG